MKSKETPILSAAYLIGVGESPIASAYGSGKDKKIVCRTHFVDGSSNIVVIDNVACREYLFGFEREQKLAAIEKYNSL